MLQIIGNPVSPYVRKVMEVLIIKGLDFEFDPIIPFFGNEEFERLSPLRRIPVLIDGELVINDSTIICEYLDEAYGGPSVFPTNPVDRAPARWIEEYADSRMGDVIIWALFGERAVKPRVFGDTTDEARVAQAVETDLPAIMDWLEQQAPDSDFLFGSTVMVADLAVESFFLNAAYSGWTPDPGRWPRSSAWIMRTGEQAACQTVKGWADLMVRTRPADQRAALVATGAPLWAKSHADQAPRRGVMTI